MRRFGLKGILWAEMDNPDSRTAKRTVKFKLWGRRHCIVLFTYRPGSWFARAIEPRILGDYFRLTWAGEVSIGYTVQVVDVEEGMCEGKRYTRRWGPTVKVDHIAVLQKDSRAPWWKRWWVHANREGYVLGLPIWKSDTVDHG
jgi:hypothetical protein